MMKCVLSGFGQSNVDGVRKLLLLLLTFGLLQTIHKYGNSSCMGIVECALGVERQETRERDGCNIRQRPPARMEAAM